MLDGSRFGGVVEGILNDVGAVCAAAPFRALEQEKKKIELSRRGAWRVNFDVGVFFSCYGRM